MKHTPRFHVFERDITNNIIHVFDENILQKMIKVLRLKKDSEVEFVDHENSIIYKSICTFLTKDEAEFKITEKIVIDKIIDSPSITIAQALPKSGKIEEVIRSNTELGVNKFILFGSDFSQVKFKNIEHKLDRFEKIVSEATLQAERLDTPEVVILENFQKALLFENFDYVFVLHSRKIKESKNLNDFKIKNNYKILIVCGPEGGFSDKEINFAKESKAQIIFLDTYILRCEHAAFAAASKLLI